MYVPALWGTFSDVASTGERGQRNICQKLWKRGKKREKSGRKGKIGAVLSLCPSWQIGLATLLGTFSWILVYWKVKFHRNGKHLNFINCEYFWAKCTKKKSGNHFVVLRVRAFFHKTVRVCHVYCNFKIGFTCRITVIFGTLKDGSLLNNTLASNICFSYRNMFQNGVDALSKIVDAFLSKSSKFHLVRIIR